MMRRVAFVLLSVSAAVLWWTDARVGQRERNVRLELSCHADRCEARIDGAQPLVQEIPGARRARRIGMYAYHPWEGGGDTLFRNLRIEREPGSSLYDLSLTELDHAGWFENDRADGWKLIEGAGLAHRGTPGTRTIALLAPPTANDFSLSVDLVDPVDAGIAFRGYDADNTWLFVVRSAYNDAFFCRLHRGEPQEIEAIMPLRELTTGRETLRLAGLLGRIVLVSGLLLLALHGLVAALARSSPKPRVWSLEARPVWIRVTLVVLFAATVLICASIATSWLHRIPHFEDESAYLFQARVFAAGQLWAQTPANPQFFEHEHLIVQGQRWFSKYPPLFSALLALGVLLGAPWIVNPLLAALTGWLVYRLGRELAGPVWGLIAWALLLASPFFVVMGATLMSHMLAAMLGAAFLLCAIRAVRTGSRRLWFAAGLCLSLAMLARPYTAALLAAAAAPVLIVHWIRDRSGPARLRAPLPLLAGVLPGIVLFLAWGALHAQPGTLLFNPYSQNESSDTLGFGPDKGATWLRTWGTYGHTPAKALRAATTYLDYTSRHQFGWPLRLSFAFALAGFVGYRRRGMAWMLALIPLALAVGHGFYWATQHLAYGARYWFAGVPALVLLTVLGIRALVENPEGRVRPYAQPIVAAMIVFFIGYNVLAYLPKRLQELPQLAGITADLAEAVVPAGVEHGIVFVRTQGPLFNDGFHLNDPTDPDATLFAQDRGAGNAALMRQYPDREVWSWDGERLASMSPRAEARP